MRWMNPGQYLSASDEEHQRRYQRDPPSPAARRWPSDRAKREWDVSISAMTGSTTVMMDSSARRSVIGSKLDESFGQSIGSDTTFGRETYLTIEEVEASYTYNGMLKEIDDLEFITVKSGILDRNSADGRSSNSSGRTALSAPLPVR